MKKSYDNLDNLYEDFNKEYKDSHVSLEEGSLWKLFKKLFLLFCAIITNPLLRIHVSNSISEIIKMYNFNNYAKHLENK